MECICFVFNYDIQVLPGKKKSYCFQHVVVDVKNARMGIPVTNVREATPGQPHSALVGEIFNSIPRDALYGISYTKSTEDAVSLRYLW